MCNCTTILLLIYGQPTSFHGGNIRAVIAAAANITMLFVYVRAVWPKPKSEVVFSSAEAKPQKIKLSLPC